MQHFRTLAVPFFATMGIRVSQQQAVDERKRAFHGAKRPPKHIVSLLVRNLGYNNHLCLSCLAAARNDQASASLPRSEATPGREGVHLCSRSTRGQQSMIVRSTSFIVWLPFFLTACFQVSFLQHDFQATMSHCSFSGSVPEMIVFRQKLLKSC